jgi:hypothetical protein
MPLDVPFAADGFYRGNVFAALDSILWGGYILYFNNILLKI